MPLQGQSSSFAPSDPRSKTGAYATGGSAAPKPTQGGSSALPPSAPTTWAPVAPNISAQTDPTLDALQGNYDKYISDVEGNTGRIMDTAASQTADLGEGRKTQARLDAAARGGQAGREIDQIGNDVQRSIAGQNAQIALGREGLLLEALGGAGNNASANIAATQGEKQLGLSSYNSYNSAMGAASNANLAAQNSAFDQEMALLEAKRTSPAYVPAPTSQSPYSSPSYASPPSLGGASTGSSKSSRGGGVGVRL